MSSIKAVLFDLDGTLMDRTTAISRCIADQHDRFSAALAGVPKAEYVARFTELDCRGHVTKDIVYPKLLTALGLPTDLWRPLYEDYAAHFQDHIILFPYAVETLIRLHELGFKLGLISNGRHTDQYHKVERLGLVPHFDTILTSGAEGVKKPDPEIFRRALDRLSVSAADSVFIGDHPDKDIAGARAAGMYCLWKRDDFWSPAPECDGIVQDLREIPDLVGSLCHQIAQ